MEAAGISFGYKVSGARQSFSGMLVCVTSPSQRPHEVTLMLGGHGGSEKLATGAKNPQLAQFSAPSSAFSPYCPEQLIWRVEVGAEKGGPQHREPQRPHWICLLYSVLPISCRLQEGLSGSKVERLWFR